MGIENSAKGEQGILRNMELYTYTPWHAKRQKNFYLDKNLERKKKIQFFWGLSSASPYRVLWGLGAVCPCMHVHSICLPYVLQKQWSDLGKYCYSCLCWKQKSCNPWNTSTLPRKNYTFEVDEDNRIPIFIHVFFLHNDFTYFTSRNSKNQMENTEVGHCKQPQLMFSVFLYWNVWSSFIS